MRKRPYSINFDESTVNGVSEMTLNVAFLTSSLLVERRCFTILAITEGSTGKEMAQLVLAKLEENYIPTINMMSIKTDGCSAMIGKVKGAQKFLRDEVPTVPDWGGCVDHDLPNILKAALKVLCTVLTTIYPAMFGCLAKHSMHKKREFESLEEWVGGDIKKVPKWLDVRFRVIKRLAEWCESQDRALYLYFSDMKGRVEEGKYEASETEMIVLENYLENYLEVRLSQCFVLCAGEVFIELINFFESGETRIHLMYDKLTSLLVTILSRFVKDSAMSTKSTNNNKQTKLEKVAKLLEVKYKERKNQVNNQELWLGPKVESLLVELGLTRASYEIEGWLTNNVRGFYTAAMGRIVKYFAKSLQSETLEALAFLHPQYWTIAKRDKLRNRWGILGRSWSNVVKVSELEALRDEVSQVVMMEEEVEGLLEKPLDEVFSSLSKIEEFGAPAFPLMSKLGSSLCTLYNSSSPAERDFSLMNNMVGDGMKNRTSQLMLETKMLISAELKSLSRSCTTCKEAKKKKKEKTEKEEEKEEKSTANHCHCDLWRPSEELLESMRNGAAYKRYEKDLKMKKEEESDKKMLKDLAKEDDDEKKQGDMKQELIKLRVREVERKKEEAKRKKKEEEELKKKEAEKRKKKSSNTVEKPVKRKSQAELKREEQRKRLKVAPGIS